MAQRQFPSVIRRRFSCSAETRDWSRYKCSYHARPVCVANRPRPFSRPQPRRCCRVAVRPDDQILNALPACQPIPAAFIMSNDEDLNRGYFNAECSRLRLDRRTKKLIQFALLTCLGRQCSGRARRGCNRYRDDDDAVHFLAAGAPSQGLAWKRGARDSKAGLRS